MNMKRASILLLVALLCACMLVPASANNIKNAVVSLELAGERNVETDEAPILGGFCGTAITVGDKDIVVTALGRMYFTGANAYHSFLVVDSIDNSLLGNPMTVQSYDDSVDGTFEYYYMEENEYMTLKAGQTYYFCSDFYGATDRFYDSCPVVSTDDISFVGYVELDVATGGWFYYDAPNLNYLPIDFQYYVVGEEEEQPTEPEATEPEATEPDKQPEPSKPANGDTQNPPADQPDSSATPWIIGGAVALVIVVAAIILMIKKKKNG